MKARGPHFCQVQIYLFCQSVYLMGRLVKRAFWFQGQYVMFSLLLKLNVVIYVTINHVICLDVDFKYGATKYEIRYCVQLLGILHNAGFFFSNAGCSLLGILVAV